MCLRRVAKAGTVCRPGKLLRFSVREGGLHFSQGGELMGGDLCFEAPASQSRGHADACSKAIL